ncbi:HAMP domain-containing protein [Heliobacterium undosum]|uniref:HAMP domain-containing protein n=1 Tax=Heliomicrobium undosum TaxID=121734 RepID=A0A845L254_9FIRM|nr:cache domain-containing protein [Heliomicrobium undosum]MZP28904.1 HAMP domain-containing protein [Heliomicrobium undosum]
MLRNFTISQRIYILTTLITLSLFIIGSGLWWGIGHIADINVGKAQDSMLADQKEKLRMAVHSMAELLGQIVKDEPSEERQRELIRKAVAPVRFNDDGSGYYFVYDDAGGSVVHPQSPEFQGTNRLDDRDPAGKAYIRELLENSRTGGFVTYTFKKPDKGYGQKLAFAHPIPGTRYWVASGLDIEDINAKRAFISGQNDKVSRSISLAVTGALLVFYLLLILPFLRHMIRSVIEPLRRITQATRAIAAGNLDITVEVAGKDELSQLGTTFNDMTKNLAAARASLTAQQEQLEELVAQRTEELSDSLRQLEGANEQIVESIHYARTIQQAILPPSRVIAERLRDHMVIWLPKDIIAGDIYWFHAEEQGFLVAVVDCTGHGVPGGVMTMIAATTLGRVVNEIGPADPGRILGEMNRLVRHTLSQHMEETESNDGLDIGLCYVSPEGRLTFAGARLSLYIVSGSGLEAEAREIRGNRESIGYKTSRTGTVFANHDIDIAPDMRFYMTTDGLRDQVGGVKGIPFGKTRLLQLLQSLQDLPMAAQKEAILEAFAQYRGKQTQRDDVTMFGFRL